jgi:hypothetical protein
VSLDAELALHPKVNPYKSTIFILIKISEHVHFLQKRVLRMFRVLVTGIILLLAGCTSQKNRRGIWVKFSGRDFWLCGRELGFSAVQRKILFDEKRKQSQ